MLLQNCNVFLTVLLLISTIHGGIVPTENTCAGTLHEVRITDCVGYPCKIHKGKEYKVEIDFTPSRNTSAASVRCDTVYYGQAYRIPEQPICSDLTPQQCPLNNLTRYTYTVKFNVAYFVPNGQYPIRCGILDDSKSEQLCLQAVGIIV